MVLITLLCLSCAGLCAAAAETGTVGVAAAPSEGPAPEISASEKAGTTIYSQGRCTKFEHVEPASAVVFFVVALLLGLVSYHMLAWVPVPYTAILLVSMYLQRWGSTLDCVKHCTAAPGGVSMAYPAAGVWSCVRRCERSRRPLEGPRRGYMPLGGEIPDFPGAYSRLMRSAAFGKLTS